MARHGRSTYAGYRQRLAAKAAKKAAAKQGITTAELYKRELAASKMSAKDYAKLRSMEIAGIRGSSLNRFRGEARWRYAGKSMSKWYKKVEYEKAQRKISQRQARSLGGGSKPGAKTTTTTSSTRTAQGSGGFGTGFTLATKKQGFKAAPVGKRLTRAESIKTEQQQATEAKAAFTETKQKIETQRVAKAKVFAEAKIPKTKVERINENAQILTQQIKTPIGLGTTSDPYQGQQPDQTLVSPYLKSVPQPKSVVPITVEQQKIEQPKQEPVRYDYPQKPEPLGAALESTLGTLDKWQSYQPRNLIELTGKTIVDPIIGLGKAAGTTSAFFYNIGIQAGALIKGREPKTRLIKSPPTFLGNIAESGMKGEDMGPVALAYVKKYGFASTQGEIAEIGLGLRGIGSVVKLIPIRYQKFATPGIQYVSKGKVVDVKSLALGYGTKTKPIISKVGSVFTKGKPDKLITKVIITPETQKQLLRGVKLAADSTKQEQTLLTSLETVKKIEGITSVSIERAGRVKNIINMIGSETAIQPTKATTFGVKPFESITRSETPSLLKSIAAQQKRTLLDTRLSPAEGSFGIMPYMGKVGRAAGDFDFSVSKYSLGKKYAIRTASDIEPALGRSFTASVSDQLKSAKVYVTERGKSAKVGEFLNPEEKDASGALQIITGDTLFGKAIPKGTDITQGIIHYQPYRQLLKKGESLFSIQISGGKAELTAASFREGKDVGDFINIAQRWVGPLTRSGKLEKAAELEAEILGLKKTYPMYENLIFKPDPIIMKQEASILSKLGSSQITKDVITGVGTTAKPKSLTRKEVEAKMETSSVPLIKSASRSPISLGSSLGKSSTPTIGKSTLSILSGSSGPRKISYGVFKKPASVSSGSTGKSISSSILGKASVTSSPKSAVSSITKSGVSISLDSSIPFKSPGGPSVPRKSGGSPGPGRSFGSGGGKPSISTRSSFGRGASSFLIPQRKVVVPIGIFWKSRISEPKPRPVKPRVDFIGNVHIEKISGFRSRKTDIVYGTKRSKKLEEQDIRLTRKEKKLKKFVKSTKIQLLTKPKQYFTPTKQQSKSFLKF